MFIFLLFIHSQNINSLLNLKLYLFFLKLLQISFNVKKVLSINCIINYNIFI